MLKVSYNMQLRSKVILIIIYVYKRICISINACWRLECNWFDAVCILGSLKDTTVSEDPADEDDDKPPVAEVKGQVDRLRAELRQKEGRVADLEREHQTLELCIQELKSTLEEEKRSRAGVLLETEQKITEEQQRKFHSIIARMNEMEEKLSTAEKNITILRTSKMEEQAPEIGYENTVIENLEREVTRLKQEAEHFGDVTAARDEVSRLLKENESKDERVKILEQQLLEGKNGHESLWRVNFDLQAEVTNLKGVIKELEEKAALLEKESTLKQKEKADIELSDKEAQLAKKEAELAAKEAELSAVQQEALEARKREVERRRELLAVAEEAIAQKDAELQKREQEVNRWVLPELSSAWDGWSNWVTVLPEELKSARWS